MNIDRVNELASLVDDFGDIAEHAPWVAKQAENYRPFADQAAMIKAFQKVILEAEKPDQLALICAHPDLAGKAKLTKDSQDEQQGAGLDTLCPKEMARFTKLNDAYKARFGFPFIFAVKGADKFAILDSFQQRINNDEDKEFATALEMVCKIVQFRLQDRVSKGSSS